MPTARRKPGRPRKSASAAPAKKERSGIIERGKSYAPATFLDITGLGKAGARDARLRVVYAGRTAFVTGDAWLDWLQNPERNTDRSKRWQ